MNNYGQFVETFDAMKMKQPKLIRTDNLRYILVFKTWYAS